MARVTGRIIIDKYSAKDVKNSFYRQQTLATVTGKNNFNSDSGAKTLYYVDAGTGQLKSKNTFLLG